MSYNNYSSDEANDKMKNTAKNASNETNCSKNTVGGAGNCSRNASNEANNQNSTGTARNCKNSAKNQSNR